MERHQAERIAVAVELIADRLAQIEAQLDAMRLAYLSSRN